ncbi:arylsulfatase [Rhodopirellula sp. P2]|uniref:arylsulfatase n=1 Tax=Rhodopirellula sp. P2 TaxID=2127060 RepID=UPI0023681E7F|nr:arylsulfatase [Rhodopirellula sp. P2]WDQ18011.1 arylsulfatase [Rhodopirellula sp. P2]
MSILTHLRDVVIGALCLASWVGVGGSCRADSDARPNVLVILTDDQGWGDLSLHGNPNLQTPHIDSLARDGVQIQNFYVCAVCSPTRAEFLTGRYHTRSGVFSTSAGGERIDAAERTIGDAFQNAGYATAAFGKWHSGMQAPYHPNSRGFEEFYGFCSGHWGNYFSPMLEHNGEIVQGKGFIVDDLTNHAIDFMEQHRTDPFFVYLPLNTPHSPMQVPDEDWKEFEGKDIVPDPSPENAKQEDLQHTRAALALCENIDDNVGRLLEALDRLSLSENTIVVFFCDNGPNGSRFNGGLRGRKGAVHEGGLRSPCLIRYPEEIQAGRTVGGIAGAIDLFPTLADLCGVEVGATAGPLDGMSLKGVLNDPKEVPVQRLIFTAWKGKLSVRSNQYRYHPNGDLFDLQADPGETRSVAKEHPETAARMKRALEDWAQETKPRERNYTEEQVFPVGHPDQVWTQLPARDAQATGQVRRSNRFPNSSYMTHWHSEEDAVTWDVDVLAGGQFEVEVHYACPESAVGTQLNLEWKQGNRTAATESVVTVANPSGAIHLDKDRSKRVESDEKRWAKMSLGRITLSEGRGRLSLTCPRIMGEDGERRGVEIRLMMLHRVPAE